jgi:hypothetical protein
MTSFDETIQDQVVADSHISSLEKYKFIIDGNGLVRVRTQDIPSGNLLEGLSYDYIDASYPNDTTEVYEYYTGGLAGVLVATISVTYTDNTKEFISSVERT